MKLNDASIKILSTETKSLGFYCCFVVFKPF